MANYKLTNDYWEASGIYDIGQGKTQREINKVAGKTGESQTVTDDIVTITDGVEGVPVKNLTVDITPAQDLHGYANPWPDGGGKNKFGTTISALKTQNTGGTWSGNVYTYHNLTHTVNDDFSVTVSGTASGNDYFGMPVISTFDVGSSYILNGCPSGGSQTKYEIYFDNARADTREQGNGKTITWASAYTVLILFVASGQTVDITFKPMVRLSTVSDATFEPYANICPISGWTGAKVTRAGKNLIGASDILNGYHYTTAGILEAQSNRVAINKIKCEGKSVITVSCDDYTGLGIIRCLWDKYGNLLLRDLPTVTRSGGRAYVVTNFADRGLSNVGYAAYAFYTSSGSAVGNVNNLMIEFSDSANPFEPMDANTYDITFPAGAGTVYGGTLDVTNGALTVTNGRVDMGTLTWTKGTYCFYTSVANRKPNNVFVIQEKYKVMPYNTGGSTLDDKSISVQPNTNIYIKDTDYSNANAFATSLSGVYLVYELATPVTYTLTPIEIKTLLGQNNFWADTGDVNVQYGAYLTVVENQLGEKIPKLMLAPVEKTTTASKAYVLNELLIMDDTLYKVTSPIANGGTITVGTNVTETTIGAVLTSLLNA